MQAVHKGGTIDPWAVAVFDARVNDGDRIGFQLLECCNRQGLTMGEPAGVEKEPPSAQNMPPERRVEQMFAALRKQASVHLGGSGNRRFQQRSLRCIQAVLRDEGWRDLPMHDQASAAQSAVLGKLGIEDKLKDGRV